MGMYTGLSFIGYVKPEMREDLTTVLQCTDGKASGWTKAKNETLKIFGEEVKRSFAFPWGALSYMPDSWDKYGDNHDYFDGERFIFTCSLKNYDDEIEYFMTNIAPELCSVYAAIEHYEELDDDECLYWQNGQEPIETKISIEDFHNDHDISMKLERLEL